MLFQKLARFVVGRKQFKGQYEQFQEQPTDDHDETEYCDQKEGCRDVDDDDHDTLMFTEDIKRKIKNLLNEKFAYVSIAIVDGAAAFKGIPRSQVTDNIVRDAIEKNGVDCVVTKRRK